MPKIILGAQESPRINDLAALLKESSGQEVIRAGSGQEVLALAKELSPDLVIIQEKLPDMDYLVAVRKLLSINAFINTAVLTEQSQEDFHEQSEGLGILAGLSPQAGAGEVSDLLDKLAALG